MKNKIVVVLSMLFAVLSLSAFAEDFDGYIVKIKDNTLSCMTTMALFDEATLSEDMTDSEVVEYISDSVDEIETVNSDHMLVTVEDEETLELLTMLGVVESYEPNYLAYLSEIDVESTPMYDDQKWVFDAINASFAFENDVAGDGVIVGVIDSGVYPHEDLEGVLLDGRNFSVPDKDETVTDPTDYSDVNKTIDKHGHGTFISGVIAAQCNDLATVGLATNVKIVPLKVINKTYLPTAKIIEAVYYAVDTADCDVINLSLGTQNFSQSFENAINYAVSKNVIVVAAAGNNGGTAYDYPASFPASVSVANAQRNGASYSISSTSRANDMVDIAAPGTSVVSLLNSETETKTGSGTSYAAPLVTAAAALVKSIDMGVTPAEFESILKETANPSYMTSSQGTDHWGAGMLDVEALLKAFAVNPYIEINGDSVTVTNTNFQDFEFCSVTLKQIGSNGRLSRFKVVVFPLAKNEVQTISLSEYGFTSDALVKIVYDHVPGDVDGNGVITLQDALCILRKNSGYTVTGINEMALDADGNGIVTLQDALAILRYNAGYPTELH